VIPDDLYHWLNYTGISEEEFWNHCETLRDKRVWRKVKNVKTDHPAAQWVKDDIWD